MQYQEWLTIVELVINFSKKILLDYFFVCLYTRPKKISNDWGKLVVVCRTERDFWLILLATLPNGRLSRYSPTEVSREVRSPEDNYVWCIRVCNSPSLWFPTSLNTNRRVHIVENSFASELLISRALYVESFKRAASTLTSYSDHFFFLLNGIVRQEIKFLKSVKNMLREQSIFVLGG